MFACSGAAAGTRPLDAFSPARQTRPGHRPENPDRARSRFEVPPEGDEVIAAQIEKLKASEIANAPVATPSVIEEKIEEKVEEIPAFLPVKDTIVYDDFDKIDIRTGTILTAERVKKADKLLKLTIDLGFETRTIVSGIAEHFEPEAIIGQQVLVVTNLAPRKLKNIESNGMILTAENAEGKLGFVSPPAGWANGSNVK